MILFLVLEMLKVQKTYLQKFREIDFFRDIMWLDPTIPKPNFGF